MLLKLSDQLSPLEPLFPKLPWLSTSLITEVGANLEDGYALAAAEGAARQAL